MTLREILNAVETAFQKGGLLIHVPFCDEIRKTEPNIPVWITTEGGLHWRLEFEISDLGFRSELEFRTDRSEPETLQYYGVLDETYTSVLQILLKLVPEGEKYARIRHELSLSLATIGVMGQNRPWIEPVEAKLAREVLDKQGGSFDFDAPYPVTGRNMEEIRKAEQRLLQMIEGGSQ